MSYTDFVKPYQNGWLDGEAGHTPITAEILNNNYDAYLLGLNAWADTVITDSSYVHTDNNYTTNEKNKLANMTSETWTFTVEVENNGVTSTTTVTKKVYLDTSN